VASASPAVQPSFSGFSPAKSVNDYIKVRIHLIILYIFIWIKFIHFQILQSHIEQDPALGTLIRECLEKSFVDKASGAQLVKEFVGKLVELQG
jgi:hypothetical protein